MLDGSFELDGQDQSMRNPWIRALVGYLWGVLLFLAVAYSFKYALDALGNHSATVSQIVMKGTLVLLALAAWKFSGRPASQMGWCRAPWWNRSYVLWFVIAAVVMMTASVTMVLLEVVHPIAAKMNFLQIVVVIWLGSSFSEEVYVRGLVQSWIAGGEDATTPPSAFTPSIVASALVFASMHVPLIWSPAGVAGGLTLVAATLVLGWACAVLRARTKSLWPAIACHIFGNVAGVPGTIMGIIIFRLLHGRLPDFLHPG
jgi:membrane protease YdiL (CAAX protease family)